MIFLKRLSHDSRKCDACRVDENGAEKAKDIKGKERMC